MRPRSPKRHTREGERGGDGGKVERVARRPVDERDRHEGDGSRPDDCGPPIFVLVQKPRHRPEGEVVAEDRDQRGEAGLEGRGDIGNLAHECDQEEADTGEGSGQPDDPHARSPADHVARSRSESIHANAEIAPITHEASRR